LILFISLLLSLISCLLSSWHVCAASCVLVWFVRSRPRDVGFVSMFHLVSSSSVSVLRVHSLAVCCTVHLIIWEKQQQVFASFPRVRSAANKAAGSSCPQGSRFSAGIGLCRSLWRVLAAAAEVADSSSSKSVCLRRGEHPAERAGSGLWVGTPDPVDLSSLRWAPPHSSRPR